MGEETSMGFNIISLTDIKFYSFNLSTLLLVSEWQYKYRAFPINVVAL